MENSNFYSVPQDLLVYFFSTYLSDRDKHALSLICKKMREIGTRELVWKESAEKKGKTDKELSSRFFVRDYTKRYNRIICQHFPEAKTEEKNLFLARGLIDLNIKSKLDALTTKLESLLMDKDQSLETIDILIEAGAKPTQKALTCCLISGSSVDKLKLLIQAGATPTPSMLNTATLHKASIDIIKTLVNSGAKAEQPTKTIAINTRSSPEIIAMFEA